MRVLLRVDNDEVREKLVKNHDVWFWSKDHNQLVAWEVQNAGTVENGGIHLHRDDREDIIFPDWEERRDGIEEVEPAIEIISAVNLPENRSVEEDRDQKLAFPENMNLLRELRS